QLWQQGPDPRRRPQGRAPPPGRPHQGRRRRCRLVALLAPHPAREPAPLRGRQDRLGGRSRRCRRLGSGRTARSRSLASHTSSDSRITVIIIQFSHDDLALVVWTEERAGVTIAYPDSLVGTDSHTTMVNGLGVFGWGVGGIEAEAVMLGQPTAMLLPEVVG